MSDVQCEVLTRFCVVVMFLVAKVPPGSVLNGEVASNLQTMGGLSLASMATVRITICCYVAEILMKYRIKIQQRKKANRHYLMI